MVRPKRQAEVLCVTIVSPSLFEQGAGFLAQTAYFCAFSDGNTEAPTDLVVAAYV